MSIFPLNKKKNYVYSSLTPVAISQVLSSLESLSNREIYKSDNYLRGNLLARSKKATGNKSIHKASRMIDSPLTVDICSLINLCGCGLIFAGKNNRKLQTIGSLLVLGNNKLVYLRNNYGRDGADQMGNLILSYRIATSIISDEKISNDLFLKAINFQACLSYLVPGVAKAISNKWLRGIALKEILMTNAYGTSPVAQELKKHPELMRYLTWFTIVWETGFPVIYYVPEKYVPLCLNLVKGFHLGVAFTMGLPRFFLGIHGCPFSNRICSKEAIKWIN